MSKVNISIIQLVSLFPWFVHSSSSSSVSCSHLSPTALNSNPPCIGRWLTSVKFWCKVDVHWFSKLSEPIRTDHILQIRKWLEISKCQQTITPHQWLASLATNSHCSRRDFHTSWKLCPYFEKYRHTSVLLANFRLNTGTYRRVGRSAKQSATAFQNLTSQTYHRGCCPHL